MTPDPEDSEAEPGTESQAGSPFKGGKPHVHNGVEVSENMEGDDSRIIMDRAVPFIQKAAQARKPFLATIWFHTPHEPVVAGPEYRKLYASLDEARQHYYGAITAMDEQIGRLRAELRRLGIEQNTIIIFTSDNGPSGPVTKKGIASAGPFRGHKHTMYEGGLRVPTVIEWPGHVTAGRTSDVATATVDIFLTVVDLTGAKLTRRLTRPIDGVSRKALLAGSTEERSAPLFFGYRRLVSDIDGQALVENRYKLVRSASPGGGYQLFDLLEDPSEKNDLAKTKPEIFNRMRATMAQYDESCRLSRDGADYEH